MASHQAKSEGQSVPLPVIILAVVALLVFVSWWGYRSLSAQDRGKLAQEQSSDQRIATLAKQSGGDLSKLSESDRAWLQNMTMGHGQQALQHAKK